MSTILVVASPATYFASLGAMTDAVARMFQAYQTNEGLRYYSRPQTALMLATIDGGPVGLAGGRSMASDGGYSNARDINILYLPAFEVTDPDDLRDNLSAAHLSSFHEWVARVAKAGITIGASGAAVGHLAAAGLLDGLPVAIDPRLERSLLELFPALRKASNNVAVSETILTAATEAESPQLVARMLAQVLVPVGTENPDNPLAEGSASGAAIQDPLVEHAKLWLNDHFAQKVRIADLAARLEVSHQTLIRRFRAAGELAPQTYLQRLRLKSASAMLVETRRPVGEIAQLVGYVDIASFRCKFQAMFGASPVAFRRARQAARRLALPS